MLDPKFRSLPRDEKYVETKTITTKVMVNGSKTCEVETIVRRRNGDNWSTRTKYKIEEFDSDGNKIEDKTSRTDEVIHCIYTCS